MAHLVLPFPEALRLATSQRPLPAAVERVTCEGRTVFATLNLEPLLPSVLRASLGRVSKVQLELRFESFAAGVARFELVSSVLALPVHRLLNLLSAVLPLPAWVSVEKGVSVPTLRVNLQQLVDAQVQGLTLEEFYLYGGDVVAVARITDFRRR